uniref:Four helix bundle protein n=1 Tax=candidate division WWE3 bacterium TaxID=2053526 RepID=A0A831Z2Z7_UNCKA
MDTGIQGAKKIKHFTDLDVWKETHQLVLGIYQITKSFPKQEIYGLTNQIRRSAVSIESNIAEGFNRYHYGENQLLLWMPVVHLESSKAN